MRRRPLCLAARRRAPSETAGTVAAAGGRRLGARPRRPDPRGGGRGGLGRGAARVRRRASPRTRPRRRPRGCAASTAELHGPGDGRRRRDQRALPARVRRGVPAALGARRAGASGATDDATLRPIRDLLGATCFLHERGLPPRPQRRVRPRRLRRRRRRRAAAQGRRRGRGKLVATRRPFACRDVGVQRPETLGAALVQSNLKALLRMDAWSVGVCCAMLLRRERASPFAAAANWRAGLFSDRDAVRARVDDVFADFSSFLTETNARSDGLLFRHGWLVEVLVGLLRRDPGDRLDVRRAARGARRAAPPAAAARPAPPPALPPPNELGRFGAAAAAPATRARRGEPFRSLEAMVNIAENGRLPLRRRGARRGRRVGLRACPTARSSASATAPTATAGTSSCPASRARTRTRRSTPARSRGRSPPSRASSASSSSRAATTSSPSRSTRRRRGPRPRRRPAVPSTRRGAAPDVGEPRAFLEYDSAGGLPRFHLATGRSRACRVAAW